MVASACIKTDLSKKRRSRVDAVMEGEKRDTVACFIPTGGLARSSSGGVNQMLDVGLSTAGLYKLVGRGLRPAFLHKVAFRGICEIDLLKAKCRLDRDRARLDLGWIKGTEGPSHAEQVGF